MRFIEMQLMAIVGDLFSAGGETTSSSIRWVFLFLILYADIQKKMQDEIVEKIGTDRLPSYEDRGMLPYTEAVLHEVARIASVAPLGLDHCATTDAQLSGFRIPKGTVVLANIYAIHRDSQVLAGTGQIQTRKILGRGREICEERWIHTFLHRTDSTLFVPGKRACIGESLAKMTIFLVTTSILQHFTLKIAAPVDLEDLPVSFLFRLPPRVSAHRASPTRFALI
ncbi:unnamed protein product, partial [Darwinula stevensoni]